MLPPSSTGTAHVELQTLTTLTKTAHGTCRSWDEAYEQLQYERGACNLVQKYTPQLVRQRVMSTPEDALQVVVRCEATAMSGFDIMSWPSANPCPSAALLQQGLLRLTCTRTWASSCPLLSW